MFTLGIGATNSYSRKMRLNTGSLMEIEMMTADIYMPENMWFVCFI
jgi:hypothetical protein